MSLFLYPNIHVLLKHLLISCLFPCVLSSLWIFESFTQYHSLNSAQSSGFFFYVNTKERGHNITPTICAPGVKEPKPCGKRCMRIRAHWKKTMKLMAKMDEGKQAKCNFLISKFNLIHFSLSIMHKITTLFILRHIMQVWLKVFYEWRPISTGTYE